MEAENPENNTVNVDEAELQALINQNKTLKKEIGLMVGLFQKFAILFTGKNTLSVAMQLPKIISDPKITEQVSLVMPIIDKYTVKNAQNG